MINYSLIMAAVGESALKQKLKETDTIQWYQGKCTLKEDIKHIDQDNPKSFESIVRACINKKSYVSATDVNMNEKSKIRRITRKVALSLRV